MTWWHWALIAAAIVAGALIAAAIVSGFLEPRRARQGPDEICRICFKELTAGDAWEKVDHLPNMPEMGGEGGTYMTGYWCKAHRPPDAVRWKP